MSDLIPIERIESKILVVRGQKVLLDRDLAELYGVPTKALKQAVRRNIDRFPDDFMFELDKEEFNDWRSQFVTSNADKQGLRYSPMAFTEQGVAMLSCLLKTRRAVRANIQIIRAFVKMREMIQNNAKMAARLDDIEDRLGTQEFQTLAIIDQLGAIKKKLDQPKINKPLIGFPMPENTKKK